MLELLQIIYLHGPQPEVGGQVEHHQGDVGQESLEEVRIKDADIFVSKITKHNHVKPNNIVLHISSI